MPSGHPLRVLIAGDHQLLASCLAPQLDSLGHRVVAEAITGREAVVLAKRLRPDLVIMDIEMPEMNGLEASKEIDRERLCPIIVLSAYVDQGLIKQACLPSVRGYLVKPIAERDLEPVIELAVAGFQHLRRLEREMAQLQSMLETQRTLYRAIDCLVDRIPCSHQEAVQWIQQEARAKRASLHRVADAILHGGSVNYQYDVPI